MLTIKYQHSFKKDFKLIKKRGYDISKLEKVISLLAQGEQLEKSYNDHGLVGNFAGLRECHIAPDWLLVYEIKQNELVLLLVRTGTHSDLF